LEKIVDEKKRIVFKDFAHSPSKLRATIRGVKENYSTKNLIACFEMHTYSTLTEEFLPQYKDSMNEADTAVVFIDKKVLEKKGNLLFSEEMIRNHFSREDIYFFTELDKLEEFLEKTNGRESVYLMMSSGTFGGLDLKSIAIRKEVKQTEVRTPNLHSVNRNALPSMARLELSEEERQTVLPIFALSFLFFVLPIAWLFIQKKNSSSLVLYNLMVEFFNFQILSTLVFIGLMYLNQNSFFPIYWLPWIFHIHYTSQALRRIYYQTSMGLPQGLAVILPRLDKS
jgi:hypothetical protein